MSYLEIQGLTKKYGNQIALKNINLKIEKGEFVCILGPSGCGKSTLLRVLAGLEDIETGNLFLNGREITTLAPAKRNFGIVFQSYALFPNMTVKQNVAYGLGNMKLSKTEIDKKVKAVLDVVNLSALENKFPQEISGGQQQRVALARAIVLEPEFLLLDEPLSALDAKVREKLRSEMKSLQKNLGITTIMVTHDREEALTMADKIVVMNNSLVEQIGTPEEVYEKPRTSFVADFIGTANFMDGGYCVRPENIWLTHKNHEAIQGTVRTMDYLGSTYRITVDSSFGEFLIDLKADVRKQFKIESGRDIYFQIPEENKIHLQVVI